jgi:hypothetical protein
MLVTILVVLAVLVYIMHSLHNGGPVIKTYIHHLLGLLCKMAVVGLLVVVVDQ